MPTPQERAETKRLARAILLDANIEKWQRELDELFPQVPDAAGDSAGTE